MPRYHVTIVHEDGRATTITNRQSKSKLHLYKDILTDKRTDVNQILSITVKEVVYKED